ncbi:MULTISPECIES: acetolactate decarboxylase [Methanoculleus]|uniref:Alpha-acetolactate decarboxylase n=2 Tax=Methanoculleus TaxID=45989 RepID=A3CTQ8_METMJ|nr:MULTISPECIES: acetolactate decarboxylase [Methanoculleus]ABN56758.1 Acetolactate decarboxylase [Methanoculleus marisnigri JR1]UYU18188.1 acetolactate decarboxylase [Methanoculleus submarinus]
MTGDRLLRYAVVAAAFLLVGACIGLAVAPFPAAPVSEGGADRDTLFQVSTIDALLQGTYDGSMTFDELARHGDFGIGCGDRLDGELIGVDGEWYLIRVDGRAYPVDGDATTPFAAATFFDSDMTVAIDEPMNLAALESRVQAELPSKNLFYAIRVDGTFPHLVTRSVPAQEKPYPRLADVTANQTVFTLENVTGTAVGFWTPDLAEGINVPGYHLHFITDDRTAGGHVLDMILAEGTVQVDTTMNFTMALPSGGDFLTVDLSGDLSEDLEQVE